MNPIFSLLNTTNRWFVLVCVVMATVLGMLWYGDFLFGNKFATWMKFPEDMMKNKNSPEAKKAMMGSLIREIISRALYFMGLGQALMIGGWEQLSHGIVFGIIVWLIFVFSTQLSQTTWSNVDQRVLWITAGNMLTQTLLAVLIWYMVF